MLAVRRRLDFDRDTFAFANELVWEYHFDEATGATTTRRRVPPPDYALRCFVLVRAVRQFLYHARFEPGADAASDDVYRRLVRTVLARDPPRTPEPPGGGGIPGSPGPRGGCGGGGAGVSWAWRGGPCSSPPAAGPGAPTCSAATGTSWCRCRGAISTAPRARCWRRPRTRAAPTFTAPPSRRRRSGAPVPRRQQPRTGRELLEAVRHEGAPIVHLLRFPSLAINRAMVIFDGARTADGAEFVAYDPNQPGRRAPTAGAGAAPYDPNQPGRPARLVYAHGRRTFSLPANRYWPGGDLNLFE